MNRVIEIPLQDLNPHSIQDLQSKFPSATFRIETKQEHYTRTMNEVRFWKIIAQFDWRTTDADNIMLPAINVLSKYSINDIKKFHDILNEKLFTLDAQKYAEALGSSRYKEGEAFSADNFLYARCCVIANGETFFYSVLSNPQKMPKEYTFENLLTLPQKAYCLKTGKDFYNYQPEIWCETFSNSSGWNNAPSLKDRILSLL